MSKEILELLIKDGSISKETVCRKIKKHNYKKLKSFEENLEDFEKRVSPLEVTPLCSQLNTSEYINCPFLSKGEYHSEEDEKYDGMGFYVLSKCLLDETKKEGKIYPISFFNSIAFPEKFVDELNKKF